MKQPQHTMTLRLPAELHDRLRAQAKLEDRSLSQMVRAIIRWHLAGEPRDQQGRPKIPAAT